MSKNICNDCGYDLGDAYENCGMASDGVCPNCGRAQPEETKLDKEKVMISRLIIDHVRDKSIIPVNPVFEVSPEQVVKFAEKVTLFKEEVKKLHDQQIPAAEFSDLVEHIYHEVFKAEDK